MIRKSKTKEQQKRALNLVPSGSTLLDLVLGGGFPIGKVVNLVGDKSTGKTFLAIECIAAARKELGNKVKWKYRDAEAGFSFHTKEMYGFDVIDEDDETKIETTQDMARDIRNEMSLIGKDEILIYVLDCLDALSSEPEIERQEKINKGEKVGSYQLEKQKFMSEFFRTTAREIKDKRCLLLIISQVRDNIGAMFGPKHVRMGGKALDFYCHTIVWLSEVEKHDRKKKTIGITIKAKTTKNKTSRPFRSCFIDILFNYKSDGTTSVYGIDDISSNIAFLYDLKTDTGKSKGMQKVKWDGKEYTVPALIKKVEGENLEDELKRRTIEKWNQIEKEISPNRKSKWK